MALKLGIQALRSYLKLPCGYDLHILSNTKVIVAKDQRENCIVGSTEGPLKVFLLFSCFLIG